MLIEFQVKFKLAIQCVLPVFRRGKQFPNIILRKQGTAQYPHDLYDWTSQFEVVFDDSDKAVCDDGHVNLNAYRVETFSPKSLDSEMLLNPFKEQLDLPSVFIKESNVFCCKVEVVRIISERAVQVWGIVHNTSDSPRVLRFVLLFCKDDGLVTQYIVRSVKNVFSIHDFVSRMPLFTDDKEGPRHVNLIKSDKVKVPSVKDIASQQLICEPIHCIDIMHISICDAIEYGNLRDDIHLSVNLDARLRAPELRPVEERHAKVNRCGIHCVESAMQFKLSCNPSLLCKEHHVKGKLLKYTIIPEVVCLGKRTLVNRCLSESEMKRLLTMGSCYICEFSQPLAPQQLSEHKDEKMAPARRSPILGPVGRLGHKTLEIPLWEKIGELCENILSEMHRCPIFDLGANVRISKVRQGMNVLMHCA